MNIAAYRIIGLELLGGFSVRIEYSDGVAITRDLEPFLSGAAFSEIRGSDPEFKKIRVENGTLCWPNGADLDPLVLYFGDHETAESHVRSFISGRTVNEDPEHPRY